MASLHDYREHAPYMAVAGCAAAAVLVLYLRSRKPPAPNVFATDARRPPPGTHRVPEDKIKTIKPTLLHNPDLLPQQVDIVIIGSGASGLTCAAILSKAGYKVLLLEQHGKLGGACHSFNEGRFEFDTGLHYIGDMEGKNDVFRCLDQLTEGQLEWYPMDPVFDRLCIGEKQLETYDIVAGYESWSKSLKQRFPGEEKAIDEFERLFRGSKSAELAWGALKLAPRWVSSVIEKVRFAGPMKDFSLYFEKSAQEVVDSVTKNKALQACVLYSWGDYAMKPNNAPFFMPAAVSNHYIKKGGFYPKNGSAMIPYYMAKTIAKHGGICLSKATVESICLEKSGSGYKTSGVVVSTKNGPRTVKSKLVISSAGLSNTFRRLIPQAITSSVCPNADALLQKSSPSIGYLNLFVGLKSSAADLNLPSGNTWMFPSTDFNAVFDNWMSEKDPYEALDKYDLTALYVAFPSAKDKSYEHNVSQPGSTCVAITFCPYSWFSDWNERKVKKRGEQYQSLKDAFTDKMIQRILQKYPQLEGQIEMTSLGTPVTSNHYYHTERGEVYGRAHDLSRFSAEFTQRMRPETEIQGLYLTGQDLMTCGVSSAVFAGMVTCWSIMDRNVIDDLKNLYKSLEKENK